MINNNLCSIFFFSQAKVALNLQPKQSEPEPNEDEALKREKLARNSLHSSVVKTLEEEKAFDVVPSTSHVMDITDPQSTTLSTQKSEETMKMIDKSNVKTHSQDATEAISEPMVEDESEEEIGEIHIVGYQNAKNIMQLCIENINVPIHSSFIFSWVSVMQCCSL